MKSRLYTFLLLLVCSVYARAQQYIAQPYYSENKIRFYDKVAPVAASPYYTLDVSADVLAAWGASAPGINDVVIYNSKIFVSFDFGSTGGVLIYNYADVFPVRTATAPLVIKPGTPAAGLSSAGIAINPANGDLYIPTYYNVTGDAGVYKYTSSSGYASGSQFASFFSDANSVASICANLAFDAGDNLWMTTWDGTNDPTKHYLICYKGANKNNYYKIKNAATKIYSATDVAGGTIMVHLLSAPEGIAFDPAGNLWLGNNNDVFPTNLAGQGTLVKISSSYIGALLAGPSTGTGAGNPTYTVPTGSTTIDYIPSGKLGGMLFDADTLYINDQGQTQGASYLTNGTVWKYNITGAFNTTNFAASGIHTTYPGNGGMSLNNSLFPIHTASVKSVADDNTKLVVMPNPVQDYLVYTVKANESTPYQITLIDAAGRTVYTHTATANNSETVNMRGFGPGIYSLKAVSKNNGLIFIQKAEKL